MEYIYLKINLFMVLNIIACYNKVLYAIKFTLYKSTYTSRINFENFSRVPKKINVSVRVRSQFCLTVSKFLWRESKFCLALPENFVRWNTILSHGAENFVARIIILSLSAERFARWLAILSHSVENLVRWITSLSQCWNFCEVISVFHQSARVFVKWTTFFMSQCQSLCQESQSFLTAPKTLWDAPVYGKFFEPRGRFAVQGNFLWIFWFVVFSFVTTTFLQHRKTYVVRGVSKRVPDAVNDIFAMAT